MAEDNVEFLRERAKHFETIEDLGSSIRKISVLLQAAVNTGAGEEEDADCLMCIAHDEAELARARYMKWALPEGSQQ